MYIVAQSSASCTIAGWFLPCSRCTLLQIVITDASWPQRGAFLDALACCLDNLQQRAPWYPGSSERLAAFKQRFPTAQALGQPVAEEGQPEGHLQAQPWLLVTGQPATLTH